jgi:squalene-hopene/tetraprenyl-beta-curcumene cyclase
VRHVLKPAVLKVLERIQPTSGGFLEAVPLTGFVVMALAASGLREHPVTIAGAEFLRNSERGDGSWPIDVNLSTWLTALGVASLANCGDGLELRDPQHRRKIRDWFLAQQHLVEHPFTHARPGGWAWTDLPGGVPDGDDTSGVLLALHHLDPDSPEIQDAVIRGVTWLLDLQNRDGGVPTFCRGWLELPFDRSCPDITAHAIAAWLAWKDRVPGRLGKRVEGAVRGGLKYLASAQHPNGTWIPLWFGNQQAHGHENPLYGTARVLISLEHLSPSLNSLLKEKLIKAQGWIIVNQQEHGGWGATKESPATIEETGLALQALSTNKNTDRDVLRMGLDWLAQATQEGTTFPPSPIGLYFSKLWYSEELYPLIFSCSGMERALRIILS